MILDLGFRGVEVYGFRGFGFTVEGLGVLNFGFRGFGFRVEGFGFRV